MRLNINYKITIIFTIIIAIILFGIFLYLNNSLTEHTFIRIRTKLLQETSLVKSLLDNYFEEISDGWFDTDEYDILADDIGDKLGLRATIITLDGKVLGDSELNGLALYELENHFRRPEVQDALASGIGESRRYSTTVKKQMLYIAATFGEDKPQGIIRLSIPLSEIELVSDRLKRLLAVSFLVAFIFALIFSFVASAIISNPLKEISWAARNIASGDFTKNISLSSNDEIGDLTKAFNYMTEQIRLRIEEVTTSKSRLEAVLLSMFEGVMVVDSKGTILLMNQSLKDFLLIKEEPMGRKPIEVLRNVEIQEIIDSTLKLKKGVVSKEVSLLLPEEKTLLIHAAPVIREERIDGAVLVVHDITELRRLERIRQDFVANVSHELRTPVSSIKGYAETLLEGALKDKENAKDFLQIIYSDSERLAKLIDDILDLSKIESGKLKMDLKSQEIKPLIQRVVSQLKKQAEDKSITINTDILQDIPKVIIDETMIAQVLLNLLDNAIKYTAEGGSVKISAKEKDKFVEIDISDTGVGIPEKYLPRLFERFYRVDKARSRELGGTGLGLSIVKHIIQAHNGDVSVESILGKGSIFSFTLPKA